MICQHKFSSQFESESSWWFLPLGLYPSPSQNPISPSQLYAHLRQHPPASRLRSQIQTMSTRKHSNIPAEPRIIFYFHLSSKWFASHSTNGISPPLHNPSRIGRSNTSFHSCAFSFSLSSMRLDIVHAHIENCLHICREPTDYLLVDSFQSRSCILQIRSFLSRFSWRIPLCKLALSLRSINLEYNTIIIYSKEWDGG